MRAHAQHGSSSSSHSCIRLIVYHLPHLPQLLSVTRSVVSLSCCQLKAPSPSYTSLTHAAENQVRLVVLALFCCLLPSCPSSPLPPSPSPSCSPAGSSFLQVKLISLQVYWVILCLAVLSRCYFCLFVCQVMSGMKSSLCLIPLRCLLRTAPRRLLMFPLQHGDLRMCVCLCACGCEYMKAISPCVFDSLCSCLVFK